MTTASANRSLWENEEDSNICKAIFSVGASEGTLKYTWDDILKSTQGASREDSSEESTSKKNEGGAVGLHATATPFYPSSAVTAPPHLSGSNNIETILKLISQNVYTESDVLNARQETNNFLDAELSYVEDGRRADEKKLEELSRRMVLLESIFKRQEEYLNKK
ncbi:hypothetical protein AGDE_12819 [Angomonas deanei]|uniref:Uncharacterized protein n=1 Tax=Angomonas deanei TaxID=59799 RepID=A0A7G2CJ72_9TRYP|nr:hypothetical protein AGDE_12819 [Angomonas deanei]CAD2218991.1 hypothetical protein, conserved [Angomonas deanei]|eukprot:EPY23428.1 hypothetical protein AGDE_12819 [Angomonas deanei]